MSILKMKGKFPHVHWLDLNGDNTLVECAVLREDSNENIMYIQIDKLDTVDKQRLMKILSSRNIESMELWDAMSTVTLGNGLNALAYFHQLVRVVTSNGSIMRPSLGKQGVVLTDTQPNMTPTPDEMALAQEILESGKEANVKPKAKRRGRPAKAAKAA